MFYENSKYFNEINENIKNIENYIICIKANIDKNDITGKIESDLRMNLVIKSTGLFEQLFSDIILKFAINNSSPIFHKYFENNFMKTGKNPDSERINGLLKAIDIAPVKRAESPVAYESLNSLYKLRNNLAHGELEFTETLEQITNYINHSIEFMKLVIKHMNNYEINK